MADPTPRRQVPSPLTFSPPSLSHPLGLVSSSQNAAGSPVSMPFIKRHVTRRLKAAKQECDKELTALTQTISSFFEEQLRDGENSRELISDNTSVDDSDREGPRRRVHDPGSHQGSLRLQGREFEPEHPSSDEEGDNSPASERQRRSAVVSASASSSPVSLRRQHTFPKEMPHNGPAPVPVDSGTYKSNNVSGSHIAAPLLLPQGSTGLARRFSRSINMPPRISHSASSSRSTSRSRSPMPTGRSISQDYSNSRGSYSNKRSSRILVDDPIDPFMLVLHSIIALCSDIIDMPLQVLTNSPNTCGELVQKVQKIGQAWDEHPDWHGRAWYVQLLLTVAGLSRVVEWWEAEKQFWNFDDGDTSGTPGEEDKMEQLTFVLKPSTDTDRSSYSPTPPEYAFSEGSRALADAGAQGRRSRDGQQKSLGIEMSENPSFFPDHESSQDDADTISREAERFQEEIEKAQSMNIVLELALDGDTILWVNDAWQTVVGSEPNAAVGTSIVNVIAAQDISVFRDATLKLHDDDSSTIEVEFKLRADIGVSVDPLYRHMEGKGMMMFDRIDGNATHSMWVVKPLSEPEPQTPQGEPGEFDIDIDQHKRRAMVRTVTAAEILCRICECQIPRWYFEKHSETCHESHKLAADIGECNESIAELRNTLRDLSNAIDKGTTTHPEYRGIPILSPVASPTRSGPLQLFRPPLAGKLQRMGVKKLQKRLLEQLDDILQVAAEVSIPALKDEESNEPIERQRLLSPSSERKISTVRTWSRPPTEDPALAKLVNDVDILMKAKLDSVVRMQNTVRYSEKVRQEWERKVQEMVVLNEEDKLPEDRGDLGKGSGDVSSASSEYAFTGEDSDDYQYSAVPTPIGTMPAIPTSSGRPIPESNSSFVPKTYMGQASTPSSTSSPLALATPIVPSSPSTELLPSPDIDGVENAPSIARRSGQSLSGEPRLIITPPITPNVGTLSLHRRHSSAVHKVPLLNPTSPRLTSAPPTSRTTPSSIKDFEIIKPISKGAFGSVFLAKKKVTGDYYAIKVLKKSDMIAKNQVTNVKAERMILMKQGESPFVVKLFWTFQSRDNLYLVMEYLNGGDCAALIKVIGALPEEWARNYAAEVVLGLEYLHQRGVTHRDLKPDNLLIDQRGHLKLTDFGLSRIGLLGRQTRDPNANFPGTRYSSRPPSMDSVYLSSPMFTPDAQLSAYFGLRTHSTPQLVSQPTLPLTDDVDSSGSEGLSATFLGKRSPLVSESPLQSFASELATDLRSHTNTGSGSSATDQKVVGTPDYLAPETILGISKDDRMVDWWALGVITFEFLYGSPPFHADTPDKVFENILSGRIDWHEEFIDFSEYAKNFMLALLQPDPSRRLGAAGPDEVKAHNFFSGIDWDNVTSQEAQFIPQITDPESTDYFDPRGALPQLFQDDEENPSVASPSQKLEDIAALPLPLQRDSVGSPNSDDFGAFSFKNLGMLKQANDDVIRKLKTEQLPSLAHAVSDTNTARRRSLSQRIRKPPSVMTGADARSAVGNPPTNPPSPSTSASSVASSPSYSSMGPSTPGSHLGHIRRTSEYGPIERFKQSFMEGDRRTVPSRLRTASISSAEHGSGSDQWPSPLAKPAHFNASSESSVDSGARRSSTGSSSDRTVTILIAEDNPISAKILETILTRMGCRCIVVSDGSEAVSVAQGDIRFDVIMLDLNMPIIDGEVAAQYIKSTKSKNTSTPIVSVSAYTGIDASAPADLFVASLSKPVQKADLLVMMRNLGFKTTTSPATAPAIQKMPTSKLFHRNNDLPIR